MLTGLRAGVVRVHSDWRSVDTASLLLRVVIGPTFVAHGLQKLFNPWHLDPKGISGTTKFFDFVGIPAPHFFAYFVGVTETIGGILLTIGLLTPVAGIAIGIDMLVAIISYNFANGFFTEKPKDGWEINAFLAAIAFALAIMGPGRWSLDSMLGLTRGSGLRTAGEPRAARGTSRVAPSAIAIDEGQTSRGSARP